MGVWESWLYSRTGLWSSQGDKELFDNCWFDGCDHMDVPCLRVCHVVCL